LQISNKERDVKLRFEQLSKGVIGNINLGMNSSRSTYLIPAFFAAYKKKFPHVSLSIYSDDTVHMIERLKHGTLDIMFGVSAAFVPTLDYLHLTDDCIFFIASRRLLRTRAGAGEDDISAWMSDAVPAEVVAKVPVTMNTKQSTLAALVTRFLAEAYIAPEVALRTSNFHTHLELCRTHQVAAFLPTCMIPTVVGFNALFSNPDEKLCVMRLPTDQSKVSLRIDCVLPGGSLAPRGDPLDALPAFKSTFIRMLRQTCQACKTAVDQYLAGPQA
jgi:DNA-binding transcriptional LysR family regulator